MLRFQYIIVLLFIILIAGCVTPEKSVEPESVATSQDAHADHHPGRVTNAQPVQLAGKRVHVEGADSLIVGENRVQFHVYDAKGEHIGSDQLKITHEKKMHLLLVRDDMTQFQHLHPEYADEKWQMSVLVNAPGIYQMYLDMEPIQEGPVTLRVPVIFGSAKYAPAFPEPVSMRSGQDGEYSLRLDVDDIRAGQEMTLTFTASKNGKPIETLLPYLGAYGHAVIIRHGNPDDFVHVHPVIDAAPADGKVLFKTNIPAEGRYTIFTQINTTDGVKTFPVTLDIGNSHAE